MDFSQARITHSQLLSERRKTSVDCGVPENTRIVMDLGPICRFNDKWRWPNGGIIY